MTTSSGDEYGIGAVARLTGLSDHTIRVWERRYQAVVAERSAAGRRLYRTADVEKLRLLKLLTDRGISISRIAGDSTEDLKQRLASMNDIAAHLSSPELDVAVLGDFLAAQVREQRGSLGALNIVLSTTHIEQLETDLQQRQVDALVLELPTVNPGTLERIETMRKSSGARIVVVIYTFARSRDIESLAAVGITVLKAPVRMDEVAITVQQLAIAMPRVFTGTAPAPESHAEDWPVVDEPAPRRFQNEQLAHLMQLSTSVDCECPRHLAELAAQLSAFETYSAECASRDEEERSLHEFLYRSTGRARARIEAALERVIAYEDIQC